ncbi:restriction endonuclease [Microbacterium schleiferi]|uniref:Restriction endonuclease n=1 Tax=Microbacterium schleiferi TaxID=69362 RepID=A0A7S8RHR0_9MICO|nr:restriction endonuclease [Microbacterium schleiferi]QPE05696.1 restriction endonuclease [Microbacterium schleiferi]
MRRPELNPALDASPRPDHAAPAHPRLIGGSRLSGKASSGVFITTGRFSSGAREFAGSIPTRIILIDGERLATLMIRFGVGVQVRQTVNIVEIDEDFFE